MGTYGSIPGSWGHHLLLALFNEIYLDPILFLLHIVVGCSTGGDIH